VFQCNSIRCPHCQARASFRQAEKIGDWASLLGMRYFWTFTFDPSKLPARPSAEPGYADLANVDKREAWYQWRRACHKYLSRVWNKYRTAITRKYPGIVYIAITELHKSGTPHLHVLFNRWMPRGREKVRWERYGGGWCVDARYIRQTDAKSIARYIAKYISKGLVSASSESLAERLHDEDGYAPDPSVLAYSRWPARMRQRRNSRSIHLAFTVPQWNTVCSGGSANCWPGDDAERVCPGCIYLRSGSCAGMHERPVLCNMSGRTVREPPGLRDVWIDKVNIQPLRWLGLDGRIRSYALCGVIHQGMLTRMDVDNAWAGGDIRSMCVNESTGHRLPALTADVRE
jgi:hypothetical protein